MGGTQFKSRVPGRANKIVCVSDVMFACITIEL